VPRIQRKLMVALCGLVAVTLLATSWLAERGLRQREMARIQDSLAHEAALVRVLLGDLPLAASATPALDDLARRAAPAGHARITLIAANGVVVADSSVRIENLAELENHAARPEVVAALAGRTGVSARRSASVGVRLLYVAVPRGASGEGVVRLAVELADVEAAVADLRRRLALAGALGLLAAVLLAYAISRLAVRPLSEMRDALRGIAGGDLRRRIRPRSDDELGEIALAINGMAQQLGLRFEEVTAEKEQLGAVLAGMVEGVLVLDTDGCVTLANPRLRELLSIWGEAEGRKLVEVVRHPEIDEALCQAAESGGPVVQELEVGERTILIHAAGFPESGPRMGCVGVFHDVTELRRLEGVRREFVANASHELKTPLTAIRGFAETMLAGSVAPEKARDQLDVIVRNAERLESLIADMMELSRIESRRGVLQPSEVDLGRLARALLTDLGPRLRARSMTAEVEDAEAVPAWADRRAVEQVLSNLLDNAANYTDPGGSVRVEVGALADTVQVTVSDTGIGIPPEDQARIFERFYRVDESRSRALGGTGLGLAIVRHLVQSLGGEIRLESRVGVGSSFRFTLPRADRRPA
jgi:two-component system phosphate regulon sensor histidine kinase PhoR